ncbi:hypothetical protein [Microvirga lenta]|uniref:hypothetical protein n=1 Tax=Microvirga lenta TaxID=2881337 RepID=UPI001CFFB497|nr:hypothetical protein [Microvirga lenta]MCB5176064.1 hypothetical protein [Microvirga lenta]
MNHEPRLPRAISLAELSRAAGSSIGFGRSTSGEQPQADGGEERTDRRTPLSLRNIAHPLPLPRGTELISLTTYDGRLVILTNKGPYLWHGSEWEKIVASASQQETAGI